MKPDLRNDLDGAFEEELDSRTEISESEELGSVSETFDLLRSRGIVTEVKDESFELSKVFAP